jgi:hypothetical protein
LKYCATSRKVAGSISDEVNEFFNLYNPSGRIMTLGSTQPQPGGKRQPVREADNVIAISALIVWKMWEPRRLATLLASTAYYRDSFTFS